MKDVADVWYVRFPDGRVRRAANTTVVKRQLSTGRIPPGSKVRRSKMQDWVAPEQTREFGVSAEGAENGRKTDLPKKPPRPAAPAAQTGVRDCVEELVTALDATLVRRKVWTAILAGLALATLHALLHWPPPGLEAWWPWLLGAVGLVVVAAMTVVLSQLTYVELSRLRPASWRQGLVNLGSLTARLALVQAAGLGLFLGVALGRTWLAGWLLDREAGWSSELLATLTLVLGTLVEVGLWPLALLLFLIPPVLVVEGTSLVAAVRAWLGLLRQHFARVLLYEILAAGVGLLLVLPFAVAALLLMDTGADPRLAVALLTVRRALLALLATPLLAYLSVANLYIYLHLRYDFSPHR